MTEEEKSPVEKMLRRFEQMRSQEADPALRTRIGI
jgi:hypothetical protein